MNIKKYKLLALLGVGLITVFTTAPTLNDVHGALTAPASWTFKYTNEDFPGYKIRDSAGVISTPAYTRTADGAYYNYTNTSTITTGLEVTQTFNRSNTTWYDNAGTYIPSDTKIGSDGTVGSVSGKTSLIFDNQTNFDYRLFFDASSSTGTQYYHYNIGYFTIGGPTAAGDLGLLLGLSNLNEILIPAYTNVSFFKPLSSGNGYFDAWYLEQLGVSASYEAGVDAGYVLGQDDADLLVTGFSAMVGILVNFVLMIVNLEVFGISILGLFSIVVLFASIVWGLKLIRG